jgi:hypothetical protein
MAGSAATEGARAPAGTLVRAGDSRWSNPPEVFRLKPRREALPAEAFWTRIEGLLAARSALTGPFVASVEAGTASHESLRRFARDLCVLANELPLVEGEIASRAALHGVDTVILLSYGATLAFGYNGRPPLAELARRFAAALGAETAGPPSRRVGIYLSCLRSLGLEWLEAGVAATCVDAQWTDAAPRLKAGLAKHYGLAADELECFDVWAGFDGPRAAERPQLLRELGQSGYHQYVITHAVRESAAVWRHMWDGWAFTPPEEDAVAAA